MEQLHLDLQPPIENERMVSILYTDEADVTHTIRAIPHNITFGRGSWWLELTEVEANVYKRIRMSKIMLFRKAS